MGEYLSTPITDKDIVDGENLKIKYGGCGMQGWRKSMEDTHICVDLTPDISLFGVFDGHGGQEVAIYVQRHLPSLIQSHSAFQKKDYKICLSETFCTLDIMMESEEGKAELRGISQTVDARGSSIFGKPDSEDIAFYVGCTSCVALISPTMIYVANAGDSRAVVSKGGVGVEMSYDHKPEHYAEKKRIEKAGGYVEDNRVNGVLNLSRSLGDLEYKKGDVIQAEQMITCCPDLKSMEITQELEFMIIACDGIWDCLSSQEAVDFVKERYSKATFNGEKSYNVSSIVETMLNKIIAVDVGTSAGIGCDNMTCLVIAFKHKNDE